MAKVLVVPDAHTKIDVIQKGVEIADKIHATHIVLLGDYFDDWHTTVDQQLAMLDYLEQLLHDRTDVIPLYGNHELSYLDYPCSGHMREVKTRIDRAIRHDYRFLFAVSFDGILYTHAGVTQAWLRDNKILTENAIRYRLAPEAGAKILEDKINGVEHISVFNQPGYARGGRTDAPSPLWADLRELINDPIEKVKQVVGHTPISSIECIGNCWFCDVRSNDNDCDEYLVANEGEISVVKYGELFNEDNDS